MADNSLASRVLVIDDEAAVRESVCGILSDVGYVVAEAGDGVAGVESLRSHAADAVVMDIYMPLRDGFETIRELRRVAPEVRIIAISADIAVPLLRITTTAAASGPISRNTMSSRIFTARSTSASSTSMVMAMISTPSAEARSTTPVDAVTPVK